MDSELFAWPGSLRDEAGQVRVIISLLDGSGRRTAATQKSTGQIMITIVKYIILRFCGIIFRQKTFPVLGAIKRENFRFQVKYFGEYNGEFEMCVRCVTIVTLGTHSGI